MEHAVLQQEHHDEDRILMISEKERNKQLALQALLLKIKGLIDDYLREYRTDQ